MKHSDHILFSVLLDGKGGAAPLEGEAIAKAIQDDALAWVHLDVNHVDTHDWLMCEVTCLDELIIDALVVEETRPRVEVFGDGVMVILRGVNLNEGAEPEDMVSVRLWVDAHRIISMRKRKLKAVLDVEGRLRKGKGPHNAGDFMVALISCLFLRMEPTLLELDDQMDAIEEEVIESPDISLRRKIIDVRKTTIMLRRYIAPQRDAIAALRDSQVSWLSDTHRRSLQENYNRLLRYVEDLDAVRERAQIVQDELNTSLADRLNKNMYILSVVAAIFLPLGFLTGLLGINVGGIPGAEDPNAFAQFAIGLAVLVMVQLFFFKWKKWI